MEFYKSFIPLRDKIEAGADLVRTITSTERYFSDKVHVILIEEVPVQSMLRDSVSFRKLTSLIGLKYLHQPSNFVLNILT